MRNFLTRLFKSGEATALRAARWAVIDCETSGLDPERDRLLAVAAVRVEGGKIDLGGSFSALVQQDSPSEPSNILVHGISGEAQRGGRPGGEALREFAAFVGDALPVAFHSPFDEAMLRRAMGAEGLRAPRGWLDLARLAPALVPGPGHERRALDDWLGQFGIANPARHDALGDAYATAQLLLVLLAEAERQGIGTVEKLRQQESAGRWLLRN